MNGLREKAGARLAALTQALLRALEQRVVG